MFGSPEVIQRDAFLLPKLKPLAVKLDSCPSEMIQAHLRRSDNRASIGSQQSGLKKREALAVPLDCTGFPVASKHVQICVAMHI